MLLLSTSDNERFIWNLSNEYCPKDCATYNEGLNVLQHSTPEVAGVSGTDIHRRTWE